jgi:putative pyrroloquinoline-quinone binding quinoprotein
MAGRAVTIVPLAVLALALGGCGSDGGARTSAARAPASTTGAQAAAPSTNRDWPTFGGNPHRPSATNAPTALTAARVPGLKRQTVDLPGTVDSTPIYLHGVTAGGRRRDVFVMTTTYGRTLAVDAASGAIVWTFTPPGYDGWAGSAQITNMSPVADRGRAHVFTASPDGRVHRLSMGDGREDPGGGSWPVTLTRDPTHEKLTSSLNLVGDRLIATTGGYIGDAPPYQGHVVALDRTSGRMLGVFNSLCANRHTIIVPSTCKSSDSAIWGRAGAVADEHGNLFVATGNAPYDGRLDFGDAVIELSPDARRVLRHWAPPNQAELNSQDLDLGSTSPVLVPGGVLQSGKEGKIAVLTRGLRQVQSLPNPGSTAMFSAMAVWRHGGATTVFATTEAGTTAYRWSGQRLHVLWSDGTGATSPLVVGGLFYGYDANGALNVRRASSGHMVAKLPAGGGHWQSPVVGGSVIALPQGNANDHAKTGVLNLYR